MSTPRFLSSVSGVPPSRALSLGGVGGGAEQGDAISNEIVEVDESGQYLIQSVITPHRGESLQVASGDIVSVLWKRGLPFMILDYRFRHGPGTDEPSEEGGVVEELFVAPNPKTGKADVWFRNAQQVTLLGVRSLLPLDSGQPAEPEYVRWGVDGRFFYVRVQYFKYVVFSFARPKGAEQPLGDARPAIKLVRVEDALASDVPLLSLTLSVSRSGASLYSTSNVQSGPLVSDPIVFLGASVTSTLLLTAAASDVVDIRVSHLFGDRPGPVGVLLEDVHVDDVGDLVAVARVNVGACVGRVGLSLPNASADGKRFKTTQIPTTSLYECTNVLVDFTDPETDYAVLPTSVGAWPVVVNLTQKKVLWSPFVADPELSSAGLHLQYTGNFIKVSTDGSTSTVCIALASLPGLGSGPIAGSGSPPSSPHSFTIDGLTEGDVSKSAALLRADRLPFIPDQATWFHESFDDSALPKWYSILDFPSTGIFMVVSWARVVRTITNDFWGSTSRYAPRRRAKPTDPTPLGVLVTGVTRVNPSSGDGDLGVFATDLASDVVATLMPLTPTASPRTLVQEEILSTDNGTVDRPLYFGLDLRQLLWRREYTPSEHVDEILLTEFKPGPALTVAQQKVVGPTHFTDPGVRRKVPENKFQVLRPDFLYLADDVDKKKGNKFIKDRSGSTLTLSNTAADYPPVDAGLTRVSTLKALPAGVTPRPAQIVLTKELIPGPSYRVVNDQAQLLGGGRFIKDPLG